LTGGSAAFHYGSEQRIVLNLNITGFQYFLTSYQNRFPTRGFMIKTTFLIFSGLILVWTFFNCSNKEASQPIELKYYSLDNMDGLISRSGVSIDSDNFSEGSASLKIENEKPRAVRLFETGDLDIEKARLKYQARLKSANLEGEAYLEMWCHFPGKGEYFSRTLHSKISGSTDWSSHEAVFTMNENENPDNIKLNLVIKGQGTVWIDEIRLIKIPLE
jgi:hypothetical protein